MNFDKAKVAEFIETARAYCDLIDGIGKVRSREESLLQLRETLGKLHLQVMALGAEEPRKVPDYEHADFEARFELFLRVKGRLGESDRYHIDLVDSGSDEEPLGSLADDFTDIYFDLQQGLRAVDAEPDKLEKPVHEWLETFRLHWGQHLFDAVFALNARG